MYGRLFIARFFLLTGVILAAAGLVLWWTLPAASGFPPYLITAALALGYGTWCRWIRREPISANAKP